MADRLDELHRALGRMEGKLDAIKDGMEHGRRRMDDHGQRIDKLEQHKDKMAGGAAVARYVAHAASGAVGAALAWLSSFLFGGHLPRL